MFMIDRNTHVTSRNKHILFTVTKHNGGYKSYFIK